MPTHKEVIRISWRLSQSSILNTFGLINEIRYFPKKKSKRPVRVSAFDPARSFGSWPRAIIQYRRKNVTRKRFHLCCVFNGRGARVERSYLLSVLVSWNENRWTEEVFRRFDDVRRSLPPVRSSTHFERPLRYLGERSRDPFVRSRFFSFSFWSMPRSSVGVDIDCCGFHQECLHRGGLGVDKSRIFARMEVFAQLWKFFYSFLDLLFLTER